MKDMNKVINRIMESKKSMPLKESETTVEPQDTVGVNKPPVLSQCHNCMGVYKGEPTKCPICGAPADLSDKIRESQKRHKLTEAVEDESDRKAISPEEFAEWHKDPKNYEGKDAQVKMDKIYSILDRSKTTSDDIYDQYKDLSEKDKEEITRLVFNERKVSPQDLRDRGYEVIAKNEPGFKDISRDYDEDSRKYKTRAHGADGVTSFRTKDNIEYVKGNDFIARKKLKNSEAEDELKVELEECDATDLLECGDIQKFNEKYGTSTIARNGKLQVIVESFSGRKFVIEKDLTSTQRAAFRIAEAARKSSSISYAKNKSRVNEIKKARVTAIIRNESKATRVAITRFLERNHIAFDAKKLREAAESTLVDRSKEFEDRVDEILGKDVINASQNTEDLIAPITEVIEDTGLNVVTQEASTEPDGSSVIQVRIQDEPGVEVNLQDISDTIADVIGEDVAVVGPNVVAGDSTLMDVAVVVNPDEDDLDINEKVALSESLRRKVVESRKSKRSKTEDCSSDLNEGDEDSDDQKPPKLSERRRRRRTEDLSHGDGEKVEVKETNELKGTETPESKEAIDQSEILIETVDKMDDEDLDKLEEAIKNRRNKK